MALNRRPFLKLLSADSIVFLFYCTCLDSPQSWSFFVNHYPFNNCHLGFCWLSMTVDYLHVKRRKHGTVGFSCWQFIKTIRRN